MLVTPRLEKVTFQKCNQVTNKNKVECKLGVYEDELQVLCSNANACLLSAEITGGEIRYNGKAVFTVVCSDGKELKKYESGVEFSFKFNSGIAGSAEALNLASVTLDGVEVIKQNGVLQVSATVLFKGEVCYLEECEQVSFATTEVLTKKQTAEKCERLTKVEKTFTVQDDFDIDKKVKDVIFTTQKVYITNTQCGIGSVIIDGEVEYSLAFQTAASASEVCAQNRRVPFRYELESGEVMPNNIAISCAAISNYNAKVYVDENKNKSSVTVDIELLLSAVVYENVTYTYCVDAYSLTNNLKLENSLKTLETITATLYSEQKIVSDLAYFDENAGLICLLNDKIEELEATFKNGTISVKGALMLTMLLDNGGELKAQTALVPFETQFKVEVELVKNVTLAISSVEVIKDGGKFTCSFTLKVNYTCASQKTANVLCNIEEGDKKPLNDSAISVYIASIGEDLWDVCKALNTSEEVITALNQNLTFPLESEERIIIYRELSKDAE